MKNFVQETIWCSKNTLFAETQTFYISLYNLYAIWIELFPLFLLLKFVRSLVVLEPIEVSLGGVNIATLNLHYNNNNQPLEQNITGK